MRGGRRGEEPREGIEVERGFGVPASNYQRILMQTTPSPITKI
jgi:hypothetical protein